MALTPQQQILYDKKKKWYEEQDKKQRQYWLDRAEAQSKAYQLTEEQTNKEIERIYKQMEAWADSQINAFYGKYADAEGITLATAKKRVSTVDIEQYEALAEKYVTEHNFSKKADEQMRLYNATMKINRLELLKAQIGLGLVDGSNSFDRLMEQSLTDRAVQEYMHKSGILGQTLLHDDVLKRAKNIVNADFYNATFSDRIWGHCDNLSDEIAVQLNQGLIAGISPRQMASRLHQTFGASLKDAERLAVTELARVQTEVDKDLYDEQGITEYEFMAVGPNPCLRCQNIDGEVFSVREMEIGLNAPPMHPRCHCTTAPWFDEAEYEAWLQFLEDGGSTEEWNALSDDERFEHILKAENRLNAEQAGQGVPSWASADFANDTERAVFEMLGRFTRDEVQKVIDLYDEKYIEFDRKAWMDLSIEDEDILYSLGLTPAQLKDVSHYMRRLLHESSDWGTGYGSLLWDLDHSHVSYRKVKAWETQPSEYDIIKQLGGGDLTRGSCASLAQAYVANKYGYDVKDFRGGNSQFVFSSSRGDIALMYRYADYNSGRGTESAMYLLGAMEVDKEYVLSTGHHASVVRKVDNRYQYLELQSPVENGWVDFGSTTEEIENTLVRRFACKRGFGSPSESILMDAESIDNIESFIEVMGYINTGTDDQEKGGSGRVR